MRKLFTIDFETYWDDDYSLSKMTTEEYVNDPRFQIIGVSFASDGGEARWHSFPTTEEYATLLNFLNGAIVTAHNALFDATILEWHLGIQAGLYIDTWAMARPLFGNTIGCSLRALSEHFKLGVKGEDTIGTKGLRLEDFTPEHLASFGGYCDNDVHLTQKLLVKLKSLVTTEEMWSIHNTTTMFTQPMIELDVDMLGTELDLIQGEKNDAVKASGVTKDDLMSNPKFALALEAAGAIVPMKVSPTTGEETFAFAKTDKGLEDLLKGDDPAVSQLVESRLTCKSTIQESRIKTLLGVAERNDNKFPVPLFYCGALASWRWSGMDDVNAQNFPHKGVLRQSLRAPPGCKIVVVDSSNIELRVTHKLAGQEDTIIQLLGGVDLYCAFASMLYNRDITKADELERFVGKQAMLGLQYNCGAERFREMLRQKGVLIPLAEAQDIVNLWRNTYHKIPGMWKQAGLLCEAMAFGGWAEFGTLEIGCEGEKVITPGGHFLEYHGIRKTRDGFSYKQRKGKNFVDTKIYGGKMIENVMPASGPEHRRRTVERP